MRDIELTFDKTDCNNDFALLCLDKLILKRSRDKGMTVVKCREASVHTDGHINNDKVKEAWENINRAISTEHFHGAYKVISGSIIFEERFTKSLWTFQIEILDDRFTLQIIEEPVSDSKEFKPSSIRGPASAVGSKDEVDPITE